MVGDSIHSSVPAVPITAGDGFTVLYERCYPAVFAFAYRRTGHHMTAEDVAAQTFLRAFQAYHRYEERGIPVTAWLLRIAANIMAEQSRRREPSIAAMAAMLEGRGHAPEEQPQAWVERAERRAWLMTHLAALSGDARRAVWLRYADDRALDEVAQQIGRSRGATKQLLHRTVKTLRKRLIVSGPCMLNH